MARLAVDDDNKVVNANETKKYTFKKVSEDLQVTTAWISKSIRELGWDRKGRGKKILFTNGEKNIFRNLMFLRFFGMPWKEIAEREKVAENEIRDLLNVVDVNDAEDCTRHWLGFLLRKPISFYLQQDESKEKRNQIKKIIQKYRLDHDKNTMRQKVKSLENECYLLYKYLNAHLYHW